MATRKTQIEIDFRRQFSEALSKLRPNNQLIIKANWANAHKPLQQYTEYGRFGDSVPDQLCSAGVLVKERRMFWINSTDPIYLFCEDSIGRQHLGYANTYLKVTIFGDNIM